MQVADWTLLSDSEQDEMVLQHRTDARRLWRATRASPAHWIVRGPCCDAGHVHRHAGLARRAAEWALVRTIWESPRGLLDRLTLHAGGHGPAIALGWRIWDRRYGRVPAALPQLVTAVESLLSVVTGWRYADEPLPPPWLLELLHEALNEPPLLGIVADAGSDLGLLKLSHDARLCESLCGEPATPPAALMRTTTGLLPGGPLTCMGNRVYLQRGEHSA